MLAPPDATTPSDADPGSSPAVAPSLFGDATTPSPSRPQARTAASRPQARTAGIPTELVGVALDDEPTSTGAGAPTEVVVLTGGVDLATCPRCQAANAVQRARCARCGTALQDDAEADWPSDDAIPLPEDSFARGVSSASRPAGSGSGRNPHRVGVAVVLVGAIVGALLGTWAFGLGPFARSAGPGVDFDGTAYPGQASSLAPVSAATTPVREPAGDRTFTADLAVDGQLETAWVAVDGDDATLEFTFDQPVWITALEVANGDQHDEESFAATARVRSLGIDAGFGSEVEATLISGPGSQGFRPPVPLLTDTVTLEVAERTEGVDVALSEINFVGFVADADDAAAYAAAG